MVQGDSQLDLVQMGCTGRPQTSTCALLADACGYCVQMSAEEPAAVEAA